MVKGIIIVPSATIKVVIKSNQLGLDLKNVFLVLIANKTVICEIIISTNNAVLKRFIGVLKITSKIKIRTKLQNELNNPK